MMAQNVSNLNFGMPAGVLKGIKRMGQWTDGEEDKACTICWLWPFIERGVQKALSIRVRVDTAWLLLHVKHLPMALRKNYSVADGLEGGTWKRVCTR
jgi:hypothetical protein